MKNIDTIAFEMFYFLSLALAVLAILELIWPGLVSAYMNINFVLILWLINGMIILFKPEKNDG
jgi:hypothetical protein